MRIISTVTGFITTIVNITLIIVIIIIITITIITIIMCRLRGHYHQHNYHPFLSCGGYLETRDIKLTPLGTGALLAVMLPIRTRYQKKYSSMVLQTQD